MLTAFPPCYKGHSSPDSPKINSEILHGGIKSLCVATKTVSSLLKLKTSFSEDAQVQAKHFRKRTSLAWSPSGEATGVKTESECVFIGLQPLLSKNYALSKCPVRAKQKQ